MNDMNPLQRLGAAMFGGAQPALPTSQFALGGQSQFTNDNPFLIAYAQQAGIEPSAQNLSMLAQDPNVMRMINEQVANTQGSLVAANPRPRGPLEMGMRGLQDMSVNMVRPGSQRIGDNRYRSGRMQDQLTVKTGEGTGQGGGNILDRLKQLLNQ